MYRKILPAVLLFFCVFDLPGRSIMRIHGIFDEIRKGKTAKISKRLDRGTVLDPRDYYGRTPLMYAVIWKRTAIINLLLKHRAAINARDEYGRTALIEACTWGNVAAVRILIRHRADPRIRDRWGKTALDFARKGRCYRKHVRRSGGQHHEYVTWVQTAEYKTIERILRKYIRRY